MTHRMEQPMRRIGAWFIVACAALLPSCAGTVPSELSNARLAYRSASAGPAAELAPTELHTAQEALAHAEKSFQKDSESYQTRDLAYVAQRKSEMAEAQASIVKEQGSKTRADQDFQSTQGVILKEKSEDLSQSRAALAVSEQTGQMTAEQLTAEQGARLEAERKATAQGALARQKSEDLRQTRAALQASERTGQATAGQLATEQKARLEAEKRTAEAQAALAKLAALKEDERGMVITLSGSVLFRSDESALMPGAETRLDQVFDALASSGDRNVLVEGYTDSQGSDSYNLDLSQHRADAVRDYLMHRGYAAGRIRSRGIGEGRPIADNATAEGRANNRRVEIVLERVAKP